MRLLPWFIWDWRHKRRLLREWDEKQAKLKAEDQKARCDADLRSRLVAANNDARRRAEVEAEAQLKALRARRPTLHDYEGPTMYSGDGRVLIQGKQPNTMLLNSHNPLLDYEDLHEGARTLREDQAKAQQIADMKRHRSEERTVWPRGRPS